MSTKRASALIILLVVLPLISLALGAGPAEAKRKHEARPTISASIRYQDTDYRVRARAGNAQGKWLVLQEDNGAGHFFTVKSVRLTKHRRGLTYNNTGEDDLARQTWRVKVGGSYSRLLTATPHPWNQGAKLVLRATTPTVHVDDYRRIDLWLVRAGKTAPCYCFRVYFSALPPGGTWSAWDRGYPPGEEYGGPDMYRGHILWGWEGSDGPGGTTGTWQFKTKIVDHGRTAYSNAVTMKVLP